MGLPKAGFRADIQLLRGLAIALVFVFHLRPDWLPSGFLGVDMFFVVSGFLMGALYDFEKITAGDFYLRRARRILPAYFVTIVATVLASAMLLLPHEMGDVARFATFSSVLAGNIGPWMETTYFNSGVFNPLLHLWSLGVEAQFYVILPVLAWVWRRQPWALALIAVGSLAACLYVTGVSPKTSFFITPFRLWQFLAGFFAAKALQRWPDLLGNKAGGWLGIGAVAALAGGALIPIAERMHPHLPAVGIVVGTATVLLFGLPQWLMRSWVGGFGAWLGKYSYSIYLVHFPVIALYLYQPFGGGIFRHPAPWEILGLLAITIALSMALYHAVEWPMRTRGKGARYWYAQGVIVAGVVLLAITASSLQAYRFTPAQRLIFAAWNDRTEYRCGKLARIKAPTALSCPLTPPGDKTLLLVGDSHADSIKTVFAETAREEGASVHLMAANCAPGVADCAVGTIVAEALRVGAGTIVVHNSPGAMATGSLDELIMSASASGVDVALIEPVPTWRYGVPRALYEASLAGGRSSLRRDTLQYASDNRELFAGLASIRAPRFRRYETVEFFCHPNCEMAESDGRPLYFDGGHLTLTGARRLTGVFREIVRDAR